MVEIGWCDVDVTKIGFVVSKKRRDVSYIHDGRFQRVFNNCQEEDEKEICLVEAIDVPFWSNRKDTDGFTHE